MGGLARARYPGNPARRVGPTALKSPMMAAGPCSRRMMYKSCQRLRNWPCDKCTLANLMPLKGNTPRSAAARPRATPRSANARPPAAARDAGSRRPGHRCGPCMGSRKKWPPTRPGRPSISTRFLQQQQVGFVPPDQGGDLLEFGAHPPSRFQLSTRIGPWPRCGTIACRRSMCGNSLLGVGPGATSSNSGNPAQPARPTANLMGWDGNSS